MLRSLVKYGLPKEDLITIFVGYIRPLLEYASPAWSGGLTQNPNERLERIQKRALRIILRGIMITIQFHLHNLNYKD